MVTWFRDRSETNQLPKGRLHAFTTISASAPWLPNIARIEADYQRGTDTHLIPCACPRLRTGHRPVPQDESTTHGQPRSTGWRRGPLFCTRCAMAGCTRAPTIVDPPAAPGGSRPLLCAAAGAAVCGDDAAATRRPKVAQIKVPWRALPLDGQRGRGVRRGPCDCRKTGGHYMGSSSPTPSDATDWRGNNIAEHVRRWRASRTCPRWIVVGAGTGGTSATVGHMCATSAMPRRCVADPAGSVFNAYHHGQAMRR